MKKYLIISISIVLFFACEDYVKTYSFVTNNSINKIDKKVNSDYSNHKSFFGALSD